MNRFVLSIVTAVAFSAGMAFAQASPPASEPQNSPGAEQTQHPGQPGMTQPGEYPQSTPTQPESSTNGQAEKTEHKIKGCVESQGSQFALKTRKGKEIALSGQDVSAHVGHEVELQGTWEAAAGGSMSPSASGTTSDRTFNVTDVKMISETCTMKSKNNNTSNPTDNSTTPTQPQ